MFGPGEYQEIRFWFTTASEDIMQRGELWISGDVKMWVLFDEKGRVTGVMGPNIGDSFFGGSK